MTLLFMDGFDHYASEADMQQKWGAVSGGLAFEAGRHGGQCVRILNFDEARFSVDGAPNEVVLGFAMRAERFGSTQFFLRFNDNQGDDNLIVDLTATGLLSVTRGSTVVLGTSTGALGDDTWHYIEIQAKIANSGGLVKVWLDGVLEIDYSGDTQDNADAEVGEIHFDPSGLSIRIDDLYLLDTTGTVNNARLGDCRIETLLPDSDAGPNQFTATGAGTTHADRVDDVSPDDDTTYLSSDTVGHRELFGFANLSGSVGAVHGVQLVNWVRKDGAGDRSISNVVASGASEVVGTAAGLSIDYSAVRQIVELDPDTAAAWTGSGVDAIEAGIEIAS